MLSLKGGWPANIDMPVDTMASYLDVFSRLFITDNQPPFSTSIRSSVRVKQAEKRHFSDSSLACALLKATPKGIECHVVGSLNEDEILKIAENISK